MYRIDDLKEIDNYFLNIQRRIEKELNDSNLNICINKLENGLASIKIKSLSRDEEIINYLIKSPTKKSIKDNEIEGLSNKIVGLYHNSKDKYFFYLSDILKRIKLNYIIKEIQLINKGKNSYRDISLDSYFYEGSYAQRDFTEKYSNYENKLKIVEEINIDDIKDIYKSLKTASKKKTSMYKIDNIWKEEAFEDILSVNLDDLDNIKFIDTVSTPLSLTNKKDEKYKYVLKELILTIYNKKEAL